MLKMINKVIIVQVDSVLKYPPTISLVNKIVGLGINTYLLTTYTSPEVGEVINSEVNICKIGDEYKYSSSLMYKATQLLKLRKNLWKKIDEIYDENSIIWVMSNIAIKHLGNRLMNYRYNLHLYELLEDIYYISNLKFPRIKLKELAQKAENVITCEYNRAQITKVWFKLKKTPLIITNQPEKNNLKKDAEITHSNVAKDLLKNIGKKKIILYQGVVDKERPIEVIAKAIEELDEKYVFVVMTGNTDIDFGKYKKTYIIPFVQPPYHLEITSHAYIGILLYTPVYDAFSSPLNSIYCAPNKIYEYSQFGLPMLGNDIPGLRYTIDSEKMGVCIETLDVKSIKEAILNIEQNYDNFSMNSYDFYTSQSNEQNIKQALDLLEK